MSFRETRGEMPELHFQRPDGRVVDVDGLREGRPLALVFLRHFG